MPCEQRWRQIHCKLLKNWPVNSVVHHNTRPPVSQLFIPPLKEIAGFRGKKLGHFSSSVILILQYFPGKVVLQAAKMTVVFPRAESCFGTVIAPPTFNYPLPFACTAMVEDHFSSPLTILSIIGSLL